MQGYQTFRPHPLVSSPTARAPLWGRACGGTLRPCIPTPPLWFRCCGGLCTPLSGGLGWPELEDATSVTQGPAVTISDSTTATRNF